MFYLISKERLLREISLNAKGKGKGVLNWFVKRIEGVELIFIIYDVFGVTYLFSDYTANFTQKEMLVCGIDLRSQILGVSEKMFEETTAIPEEPSLIEEVGITNDE